LYSAAVAGKRGVEALGAALEAKLLARLVAEWDSINATYFREVLRRPVFRLSQTRTQLGQWNGSMRSLEVSRPLVLEHPWAVVVEVLKHEVAHQFVDEVMRIDEPPHGPTFQRVCDQLGIAGHARAELPPPPVVEDAPENRVVQRIRKLLALAESPNQHEAEAAATAARKLMLRFNIEVERETPEPAAQRYGFRHLGRPSGRILEHDRRLALILTTYFFVDGLWVPVYRPLEGKRGSVLEICGLEPNLAMAEHVHTFLSETALRLWAEYRRSAEHTSNRDRQAFLAGVMSGFEAKLAAQNTQFQEQGLVWVPGPELGAYFKRRYPRTQTVRRGGASRNAAYASGQEAGGSIVLSKPVESQGTDARPKALRSGRAQ
jgi:hypothetical protein